MSPGCGKGGESSESDEDESKQSLDSDRQKAELPGPVR